MRNFNKWSAGNTRKRMEQAKQSSGRKKNASPGTDPIVLGLAVAFVIFTALAVFFWPA